MSNVVRGFRLDSMVWALVHANTPGSVDESAEHLEERVERMRRSAGGADAMEYWGVQLLHQQQCAVLPLDACALAFAMSQHAALGVHVFL